MQTTEEAAVLDLQYFSAEITQYCIFHAVFLFIFTTRDRKHNILRRDTRKWFICKFCITKPIWQIAIRVASEGSQFTYYVYSHSIGSHRYRYPGHDDAAHKNGKRLKKIVPRRKRCWSSFFSNEVRSLNP